MPWLISRKRPQQPCGASPIPQAARESQPSARRSESADMIPHIFDRGNTRAITELRGIRGGTGAASIQDQNTRLIDFGAGYPELVCGFGSFALGSRLFTTATANSC
ncbi:MAG: hypothetical protein R2688_01315 [Fimbriimonadaceae bacterium]